MISFAAPAYFKKAFLIFCVLMSLQLSCFGKRPNVIVIYSDDQGSLDLGCFGAKDLITPHIDALASSGVKLTNMYSPSAICSASRAGLLTGRLPARAGVPGNVSSQPGVPGMPPNQYIMPELFRDNGYQTAHVGKWHLGYSKETMPNSQGFDSSYGHMGGCIDNFSHFFYWNGPNRHDLWRNGKEIWEDGQFFGTRMVEEMNDNLLKFSQAEKPFFVYWAINFPHYPLQGTPKWREFYKDLPSPRNMYNAFISTMDEMIGEVIDYLTVLGMRENTIIIFQSDHGHSVEVRAFGGGGYAGPYRGCKGNLFEGGIKVPSIISWPAQLSPGKVCDQLSVGIDWFPTLVDLCDLDIDESHREGVDGLSLKKILVGKKSVPSPHKDIFWLLGSGKKPQWAVRSGEWKLLGNARDPMSTDPVAPLILINLADDISENKNLVTTHKSQLEMMLEIKSKWEKRIQKND